MLFYLCFVGEELITEHNSILKRAYKEDAVEYFASGSSHQKINGSLHLTKPTYAFDGIEKRYDWCSNCGKTKDDMPWLTLGVKNRIMHLDGYYIKSGCCYYGCCCEEGKYCYECCLYSWSFQISNDNITWRTIHKVEKDYDMRYCKDKAFKFSETYTCKYARLVQDETCYGDPPCIALNKFELLGTVEHTAGAIDQELSDISDDEDVSIIGHISKNAK